MYVLCGTYLYRKLPFDSRFDHVAHVPLQHVKLTRTIRPSLRWCELSSCAPLTVSCQSFSSLWHAVRLDKPVVTAVTLSLLNLPIGCYVTMKWTYCKPTEHVKLTRELTRAFFSRATHFLVPVILVPLTYSPIGQAYFFSARLSSRRLSCLC